MNTDKSTTGFPLRFGRTPVTNNSPFMTYGQRVICFDSDDGTGGGDPEAAAKAAAAKAAAEAAEKQAAEKAAAEAAEAEAAKAAAEAEAEAAAAKAAAEANEGTDDEKKALVREVMEKKAKLKAANEALEAANESLEAYKGVDPARVAELIKREADAEKAAAEKAGDFERVKEMMAKEHAEEMKALQEKMESGNKTAAEKDQIIDRLTIGSDFSGSTYIKDDLILSAAKTRQLYGGHFEVQDGVTVAYDKPGGEPSRTLMVNGQGAPLSFNDALQRLVEADPDKKTILKAKTGAGAGSGTAPGGPDGKKKVPDGIRGAARIVANMAD